ncbi:MAG: hypothetical protein AMJ78_04190 [Omnitrophica WOR_2 bacterium SM23_29]|nr:MAG: hypothetical protein AMJ78_04190 [Omnitrophica WOR_2 bacterium SM23_29]
MKNRIGTITGLTVLFVLLSTTTALAADFSGDMIQTTQMGVKNLKIFVSGDKSRVESEDSIIITRIDKKVMWIVMPQQRMYMEQSLSSEHLMTPMDKYPGEIERTLIGREVIDGRAVDKYRIVTAVAMGATEMKSTMYQWFAPDLGFPVKMAAEDGSWTVEYKNIRLGGQAASLFEVPAGYQKSSGQMMYPDELMEEMPEDTRDY